MIKTLRILFIILLLISAGFSAVYANTAPVSWGETEETGAVPIEENCPIEVQKEELIISFDESEGKEASIGHFKAEYTLYNPTDKTILLRCLFPLNTGANVDNDRTCTVLVDGKEVNTQLRYSYGGGSLNVDEEIRGMSDTQITDEFYDPLLPVTKYLYQAKPEEDLDSFIVSLIIPSGSLPYKTLFPKHNGNTYLSDDEDAVFARVNKEETFEIYVIGHADPSEFVWTLYDENVSEDHEITGEVILIGEEETYLERFLTEGYPSGSSIPVIDWYNAHIAAFRKNENNPNLIQLSSDTSYIYGYLREWLEYELEIKPHETLIHSVSAPLYPYSEYSSDSASYTYLLSPAKRWASFEDLTITIDTERTMKRSSLPSFRKTEDGYTASFDFLPEEDLTFTLTSGNDDHRGLWLASGLSAAVLIAFFGLKLKKKAV